MHATPLFHWLKSDQKVCLHIQSSGRVKIAQTVERINQLGTKFKLVLDMPIDVQI